MKRSFLTPKLLPLLSSAAVLPVGLLTWTEAAQAQIPVQTINSVNQPATPTTIPGLPYSANCDSLVTLPGCPGATATVTFGQGGNQILQSVVGTDGSVFTRVNVTNEQLFFRRNGLGQREIIFYELGGIVGANPPTEINLSPEQATGFADTLLSSIINRGIDNVFDNVGRPAPDAQDTTNNIERIDYILPSGVSDAVGDAQTFAFLVLERGGNDNFFIAAITSIDGAGNPTGYGPLIPATAADWGTSTDVAYQAGVVQRDNPIDPFLPSHLVELPPQNVRGIIFPINNLVTTPGDTVFGYSLFAGDTPPGATGPQLVNFLDPTIFPTTTDDSSAQGGLDLVAGGFGTLTTPTQGAGFTLTPDTDLTTQVGVPVDHPFTVTNTGTIPETVGLASSGTDPNYTAQIIDPATNTVITDTGVLQPGATTNLILRVTPNTLTTTPDQTIVTGTTAGGTQQVTKTTRVPNFTIVNDTQLQTTVGVPVDHPFTVTNVGAIDDTISLVTEGTDPNYTVEIIDPATGTVVTDTGLLGPGATRDLILRVTPGPNATTSDTTIVRGTSVLNQATQTVTKQTLLPSGNFVMTPDSDLFTTIGRPARHDFEVTLTGPTPDTIDLTTAGTDPNYTVEIINRTTGQPLTDTDGDGVIDTGSLNPNQTALLTLLTTPNPGATVPDTTVVTGTNATGGTQQVTKITRLANFLLTDDGQLTTTVGVPVDHPFSVTNLGTVPDTISLVTEGTTPGYTVEIIDPATGTIVTDTGLLAPNEVRNLILRVTPGPNVTTNDATIIRGTSTVDQATQTITKQTLLPSGNFVMTPDSDLFTNIGRPARHDFEVTLTGPTPDTIDITTAGTDPNYTVQIINRTTGQPLTDSDGDGVIDTGSLNPNQTVLLTLLTTPIQGATVPDTTVITGTDSTGGTQQVTKITRLANFSLTDNGELQTTIGQPIDHPFTVTNLGTGPDIINLVPEGTDPNYTVEFIDPATGNPLPDTNGDNIPDTGSLPPGGSVNLILRVTPGPNAVSPDTTTVRGIAVGSGATLTIDRVTSLPDRGAGNISLTKRITRVFRASTGQVEIYNTENPANITPGFVGVTSPTPQELAPGDLVEYTIYFSNPSSGRVTNLEICDPIPTESRFLGDPTAFPGFQDIYGGGQGIAYDAPSTLPLGNGDALSNVFDDDQGEFVNPLAPRPACPGQTSGNQGAVVVRVGTVEPGEVGFIKFVTQLQ